MYSLEENRIKMYMLGWGQGLKCIVLQSRANKNRKMSSFNFKSNENIHKKEDGSYFVVSANKASSATL